MAKTDRMDNIPLLNTEDESMVTAEKIENTFLTCPVCFEVYDNPKCLPCLHSFCSQCLLSYIESKDMYGIRQKMGFPCPVCKQVVSIRNYSKPYKQWLDEIQNNFLIQNMIDCIHPKRTGNEPEAGINADDNNKDTEAEIRVSIPPQQARDDSVSPPLPVSSSSLQQVSVLNTPIARLLRLYSTEYDLNHSVTQSSQPGPLSRYTGSVVAGAAAPGQASGIGVQTFNRVPETVRPGINFSSLLTPNPHIVYGEKNSLQKGYEMTARNWADYKPPKLSDVICLPKHNGIIVLDWGNRCVKYVKNVFLGRNVTTAMEVVGRPCCVALLDKVNEDRIVVSLLNRNKLYFLRVPDLYMIDVMDTARPYCGLTVLSSTAVLAGSPGKPTCIDLIRIDHRCKMITCNTIYKSGSLGIHWSGDLGLPHYIAAVSATSFVVSDAQKGSLVHFDIEENPDSTNAMKRFTLTPPAHRAFRNIGGMCYHEGSVYVVDTGGHEVFKVTWDRQVQCDTILKARDVKKPASVCVGPRGEVCVVDWEGRVSLFKPR